MKTPGNDAKDSKKLLDQIADLVKIAQIALLMRCSQTTRVCIQPWPQSTHAGAKPAAAP